MTRLLLAVPSAQEPEISFAERSMLVLLSLDASSQWSPTGQTGCVLYRVGLLQLESIVSLTANSTNMNEGGETAFFGIQSCSNLSKS